MDIVKELTRLHKLAGETTVLNFRALMQNELRKLIEQAQEEAAQPTLAVGHGGTRPDNSDSGIQISGQTADGGKLPPCR